MRKYGHYILRLCLAYLLFVIFSCNSTDNIPFPEDRLSISQPVSEPLQFTPSKKLIWDTAKQGDITPVVKSLDINALPSTPYDSSGFRPMNYTEQEISLDWNTLPSAKLNIDALPQKPLQFKSYVLPPPTMVKALPPYPQKDKALSVYELGLQQGLPITFVTCLLKDGNGLWIASFEGLFHYDGEYIQSFLGNIKNQPPIVGLEKDNNGRIWYIRADGIGMIDIHNGARSFSNKIYGSGNRLFNITKDEKGMLWVYNIKDNAISIIDPETATFKNIGMKEGLSDSTFNEVILDEDNNIWANSASGGVNIINRSANKVSYLKSKNGLTSDTLSSISRDSSHRIIVADRRGNINIVDKRKGIIKKIGSPTPPGFIIDLAVDATGHIWMGTGNGIKILDTEKRSSRSIRITDGLRGDIVLTILPDAYHKMWIGTDQGLSVISQYGETVHPLGQTAVVTMLEDKNQNLWVGTRDGMVIIDSARRSKRLLNTSAGIADNFIQNILRVGDHLWISTDGGLEIFDPKQKTLTHIGKSQGLVNDTIYAAFKDRNNNTWLTGPSNGIDLIDSSNKMILHAGVSGGLSDYSILDIKQDENGLIWLATSRGGVNIFDPANGTLKILNKQPGLRDTCSKMMLLDKYNRMWIGTDKGIYIADTKSGTITTISTANGLSSNRILSLLEYKGSIIAGTNYKASIITAPPPGNSTSEKWQVFPLANSDDLSRLQTNAWSTDAVSASGQFLWGDQGISIVHNIVPEKDSFVTYVTGMHVMTQPQYFVNDHSLEGVDTLWTSDTLYQKDKNSYIAGAGTQNNFSWDSVLVPYNIPVGLKLPFDQNYLQFQFAQSNTGRQDTTLYSYILEGIDRQWSEPTPNTFTQNYLNLPAGHYKFKVSSKQRNGQWTAPAEFSFTITPPWYKTWWAFTILGIMALALLRAYIVYRSRKLKRENKILEEKIAVRTSQLQKSLEDLKATQVQLIQSEKMASLGELTAGIAHEIQNPLNFVNNFSEVNKELIADMNEEIEKGNYDEVKAIAKNVEENEEKIIYHGKRADSIVKGMLQHSRNSSGVKELTDINALADECMRLSYHGLRAKDKSFNAKTTTDFDSNIPKINIASQDIGRVILNLFTNAFYSVMQKKKQLGEKFDPVVSVSTSKTPAGISIAIRDNGNGVPDKVMDKIFQPFFTTKPVGEGTGLGLSMSYEIITKGHGGELKVNTEEGKYAEFIISLPLNHTNQ
jgi:signal transduction histidine kinase/ligand-binding sensor domain-containing protein